MSWTISSVDDLIEARQAGLTWKQIAEKYRTTRNRVRRIADAAPNFPPELLESQRRAAISNEELRQMIDDGLDDQEIAQRLNMSKPTFMTFRRRRGFHRIENPPDNHRKTQEELDRAEALLDEGWSFRMITQETGMSFDTLERHFPGRGFTREQTIEAALMAKRLEKIAA